MMDALAIQDYKQTEIGLIPIDWEVHSIGDIFYFKNGLNKEKEFFGYGIPIVNYMDVYKNSSITSKVLYGKVSLNNAEIKNYQVKIGDILFTRTSETQEEIGISSVIEEELENTVFSGFLLRARFNGKTKDLDIGFKAYCFSSRLIRKQIISNCSYTTRALTNGSLLSKVIIPIPPLSEQKAIASALKDTDVLINRLEELIAKKKLIKQGVMQELLKPKEGWVTKKLGEVCDVRDGTHESPKYLDKGIVFVTSKNIINGKIDFDNVTYVSEIDSIKINQRSKVHKGDILMSMIGTIGNAVLVDFEPEFCIKNVALFKSKKIDAKFLIQLIDAPFFRKYLESKLDGGIQKFISLTVLRELELIVPSSNTEQTKIAVILSEMDKEIETLENKLTKYKTIKQGMMQQLLTGKIRLI